MKNYAIAAALLILPAPAWAAPIMDVGPLLSMLWMIFAVLFVIVIVKGVLTSRSFKGWLGEFRVRQVTATQLDAETYRQFHDVTLPTEDGTTQIDHIIVSPYGVFVIETKNMGGWIFGNPNHAKWTQTFGKSKNSFQNPLRQNYKHIRELEALLQIGEDKFFSVVVFTGDAEFKTDMPDNVIRSGRLARYVLAKSDSVLTESEVQRILLKINEAMLERSRKTSREHVLNLNKKFGHTSEEMHRERQRNLLKMSAVLGIMIVVIFFQNLLKSTSPGTAPAISISRPKAVQPTHTDLQRDETPKPKKIPRSNEYGILTLSAQKDTYVTLYDRNNAAVIRMEVRKGQSEDVEIKKGYYTAEILQTGKRKISTVSFIGNTGILEF